MGQPGGRGPPEPMALVTIVLSIHLIAAARIAHKFRNWQSVRRCFCTTVLALPLSVLVGVTYLISFWRSDFEREVTSLLSLSVYDIYFLFYLQNYQFDGH